MYSSIAPNDGFEMTADLNKMFTIKEPGEYEFRVESRDQDEGDVKSNILTLTVK
jgi:hypothetical protein